MKRTYTMPKAKMVRFSYNERITAASGGYVGSYGSAFSPDFCQQSTSACYKFYNMGGAVYCREEATDSMGLPDPN